MTRVVGCGAIVLGCLAALIHLFNMNAHARAKPKTLAPIVCATPTSCSMTFHPHSPTTNNIVLRDGQNYVISQLMNPTLTIVQDTYTTGVLTSYILDYDLRNITTGGSGVIYLWLLGPSGQVLQDKGIFEIVYKDFCWPEIRHKHSAGPVSLAAGAAPILDKIFGFGVSQEPYTSPQTPCFGAP
jgi:hypothetical protein